MCGLGREIGRGTWVGEFSSYYGLPMCGLGRGTWVVEFSSYFWSTYVWAWKGIGRGTWVVKFYSYFGPPMGGVGRGIGSGIGVGEFSSCFGPCAHFERKGRGEFGLGKFLLILVYVHACLIVHNRCQKVHSTCLLHDL
jgi:hypothetical protein